MWTQEELRRCLTDGKVEWRKHVLERMLERRITRREVIDALSEGKMIATYPEDRPVASALMHNVGPPPVHVVVALDAEAGTCFVITAYRPDETHFEPDLMTRRPR